MNKKTFILSSIFSLGVLGCAVAGATYALFSS